MPQTFHVIVDGAVFFDVGIGLRDIRFRLVVVIVRNEVLDGVVRQHFPELVGQLCREGLVGCHDERRPLQALDEPGRRGRLTGTGGTEEYHVLLPARTLRSSSAIAPGWSPAGSY